MYLLSTIARQDRSAIGHAPYVCRETNHYTEIERIPSLHIPSLLFLLTELYAVMKQRECARTEFDVPTPVRPVTGDIVTYGVVRSTTTTCTYCS
jgi:hypothetical protein